MIYISTFILNKMYSFKLWNLIILCCKLCECRKADRRTLSYHIKWTSTFFNPNITYFYISYCFSFIYWYQPAKKTFLALLKVLKTGARIQQVRCFVNIMHSFITSILYDSPKYCYEQVLNVEPVVTKQNQIKERKIKNMWSI